MLAICQYHLYLLEVLQAKVFTGYLLNLLNSSKGEALSCSQQWLIIAEDALFCYFWCTVRGLMCTIAGLFQLK